MRGHILLVEDDYTHRIMTEEILKGMGLTVTPADNGYAALAKLENMTDTFDLVIMDWEMPEMDGLDTTREIRTRQIKEDLPHIPVLAFTSNQREGDMEQCLAAGMDDYLPKEIWLPKWQPLLLEKLEKWIST